MDKIPKIYCELKLSYAKNSDINTFINKLKGIGIDVLKVYVPKCASEINLGIAIVKYEEFWYLEDALSKMFAYIDEKIDELRNFLIESKAKSIIEVAFRHYGTYPALIISEENMKKIHFLNINIIDIDIF